MHCEYKDTIRHDQGFSPELEHLALEFQAGLVPRRDADGWRGINFGGPGR